MKGFLRTVREFFTVSQSERHQEAESGDELRRWLKAHPEYEEEIRQGKAEIRAGKFRKVSRRGSSGSKV
jgi:hypothetical protein